MNSKGEPHCQTLPHQMSPPEAGLPMMTSPTTPTGSMLSSSSTPPTTPSPGTPGTPQTPPHLQGGPGQSAQTVPPRVTAADLALLMEASSTKNGTYQCTLCQKQFGYKNGLIRHVCMPYTIGCASHTGLAYDRETC